MELKILKEKETPLLARKRMTLAATFTGATPSRMDLAKAVAKTTGTKPEQVAVRHIYTKFGSPQAKVICHVYDKVEDLERLEEEHLKVKHKPKQEKQEAEEKKE